MEKKYNVEKMKEFLHDAYNFNGKLEDFLL